MDQEMLTYVDLAPYCNVRWIKRGKERIGGVEGVYLDGAYLRGGKLEGAGFSFLPPEATAFPVQGSLSPFRAAPRVTSIWPRFPFTAAFGSRSGFCLRTGLCGKKNAILKTSCIVFPRCI